MSDVSRQSGQFVVAHPLRAGIVEMARALERIGKLRFLALGTRRGARTIPPERTRLKPIIGLLSYIAARPLSQFWSESFRYRLLPWFDRWVLKQLQPGDHIISCYSLVTESFKFVRRHGGKTFVDAGSSHIENLWAILSEEHRRWNCPYPPGPPYWYERSKASLEETDFVLSLSSFVTNSFLERGFKPEQILKCVYPLDLSLFHPPDTPRPKDRPLTIINTGSLSLRKGTPYLLEAFRLVRQKHPSARLMLRRNIENSVHHILPKYRDLPIEWLAAMPYAQLPERLRSADIFVFPSLEDGFAFTVAEALACGLPVVTTPNTGASDLVKPGVNGEIVPIRDPAATAEAILKCWDRVRENPIVDVGELREKLSFETFTRNFAGQLAALGLI